MTSIEIARPTIDQKTKSTQDEFNLATDFIIEEVQDSPRFMNCLKQYNIPYDDTEELYWDAVRSVGQDMIKGGLVGPVDSRKAKVFSVAASAPSVLFKEFWLDKDRDQVKSSGNYLLDYDTRNEYVAFSSSFNEQLRQLVDDDSGVNFEALTLMVSESAQNGIDSNFASPREVTQAVHAILTGIRTEHGFEKKLDYLGVQYRRGTLHEDLRGIDYILDGYPVDVKSSLRSVIEVATPSEDTTYAINRGKIILFPYDYEQDYNGTFDMDDETLAIRAEALAVQLKKAKHDLRKSS